MKIQEFSNFLSIHHETVRMYRQRGLLKPVKNPQNGYYEYTDDDLFSLFFIRKLRGANISLQTISQIFAQESVTGILDNIDQEFSTLENQIRTLERKLDTLKRTRSHLAECSQSQNKVTVMKADDAKYDIIDFDHVKEPRLKPWLEQPDLCTLSLCIRKELLNQNLTTEPIPASPGFGTYKKIIDKYQLPLLETMSICPEGTYLSCLVQLDDLMLIPPDKIRPLQEYARTRGFKFVSNTTAFLVRIDRRQERTNYLFRLRSCVKKQ